MKVKTTIYLSPSVYASLRGRIQDTGQGISEYANRALAEAMAEDVEDIESIEERRGESSETLDDFLARLE